MTKETLLLVDFDRTLFNTSRFVTDWWSWLADSYGVDSQQQLERIAEFYSYVGEWRNYDFHRHIASLQLGDSVEEVLERGHQALSGQDFLYTDWPVIKRLNERQPVRIVTFGNEPYQRYKLSFAPQLNAWPEHIILEEKGDFIKRMFGDRPVVLVDDKMLAGSLPPTADFIHLDRQQSEPYLEHANYRSINTLNQLETCL